MPHPSEHSPAARPLGPAEAAELAGTLQAFATSSRLRLLWALLDGERPVDDLVQEVGLSQSAVSHQLRLLRDAKLVTSTKSGRQVLYRLHDHHLPELLAAMRHHHEHVITVDQPPDPELAVPDSAPTARS